MTGQQLTFPSAPMDRASAAVVDDVAHREGAELDWNTFTLACRMAATPEGQVDPNEVRALLSHDGGLVMDPRRYASFWRRASLADGFLTVAGWTTNTDAAGRNRGKPLRLYALRPIRLQK